MSVYAISTENAMFNPPSIDVPPTPTITISCVAWFLLAVYTVALHTSSGVPYITTHMVANITAFCLHTHLDFFSLQIAAFCLHTHLDFFSLQQLH